MKDFVDAIITEEEEKFCMWQLKLTGRFYTHLIEAMTVADSINRNLLESAYPALYEVVNKYQNDSEYSEDLKKRWNYRYAKSHPLH